MASAPPGASPRLAPVGTPRTVGGRAAKAGPGAADIGRQFGLDGSQDADGSVRACPALTFPRLLPRVENLYHFRRFEEMFRKYPSGSGVVVSPAAAAGSHEPRPLEALSAHEYAHAFQIVSNGGSQADFNVWTPFVEGADEFSLGQLWVTNGQSSDNTGQSAETGWQVFPSLYGDTSPHLFVYYTTANYTTTGDNQGCYNLSCVGFVQTNNSVVIGGALANVSSQGGTQAQITLSFIRDTGDSNDYWLSYNGTPVGYYPSSLSTAPQAWPTGRARSTSAARSSTTAPAASTHAPRWAAGASRRRVTRTPRTLRTSSTGARPGTTTLHPA